MPVPRRGMQDALFARMKLGGERAIPTSCVSIALEFSKNVMVLLKKVLLYCALLPTSK